MNTIAAMKQAINALENHSGNYKLTDSECVKQSAAIDALEKAIKREESQSLELVAVVTCDGVMGVKFTESSNFGCNLAVGTKLYTKPVTTKIISN